jgi:hypothetical protein
MHVYIYIYIYEHTFISVYIYMYGFEYLYTSRIIYNCRTPSTGGQLFTQNLGSDAACFLLKGQVLHSYVYLCIYVCIYVYIYIHIPMKG